MNDPIVNEDETPNLEAGRLLFSGTCEFIVGAARLDQLPNGDRLEVCLAGRSNVGKSSLINALTGRKSVARTSNTPGRTQQLNYFALAHPKLGELYMVDLPGYGFAKAPVAEVGRWQSVLRSYLRGRPSLRRVYLLVDARHGIKTVDMEIMEMLDSSAVSYQIVLTKADKPKTGDLAKIICDTETKIAKRPAAFPGVYVTSSETGHGIQEMRAAIAALLDE